MALTAHVDPAIDLIEHGFGTGLGPTGLAYLRSHAYFNQLAPADACLESFLAYELDPEASRPVGDGFRESVGAILDADEEFDVPLRRAVATVVTAGYLRMLSTEDPPGSDWVPDRGAEALWRFWAGHLRPSAIAVLGIPSGLAESVGRQGGRHLEAEIGRLGLKPGLLRRRALSRRCAEIARFGLVLRAGQTTRCSEAEFAPARRTDLQPLDRVGSPARARATP